MPDNKLGFDIDPQNENIKYLDFLKDKINFGNKKSSNIIFLGNPPFGKRASKAIDFINRANIYASFIAFILPNQFKKYSTHSKLNENLKLIYEKELAENSFLFNNKDYKIRTVFQIWTKLDNIATNLRIKDPPKIKHEDFEMFQYNNTPQALKYFNKTIYNWDFAVPRQGYYDYNLRIENEKDLNKKIQWIFFKAKNKKIIARLKALNFEKLAKNNTSILGFGKHDVVKEYIKIYT